MFSFDRAIKNSEDDRLGRKNFAEQIAEAITKVNKSESLVISINGDWGSGKSSVINMIENKCNKDYKQQIKIINFNPWYYSDKANLILKFFENLAGQETFFSDNKKKKNIFDTISKYAANFEPATSFIPYVSGGIKSIKETTSQISKRYQERLENINVLQKEIRNIFLELPYKILVIIDDIDRLTANEIRDIFQLVKLVGDIPNIVYLLSFDKKVVSLALDKLQEGKGEEYIEKIVQVPFQLPIYTPRALENILFEKIELIVKEIPEEDFERGRWNELYIKGMRPIFKTLRDVNRFINVLSFDFALLKNNVNTVDLLGITILKIFNSNLYSIVKNNKDLLLKRISENKYSTYDMVFPHNKEKKNEELKLIFKNLYLDENYKNILVLLFPNCHNAFDDINFATNTEQNESLYRKMQRICSDEYFDTFFLLNIQDGHISNSEIKNVLQIEDNELLSQKLIEYRNKGKITDFLDRVEDYTETLPDIKTASLINVLFNLGDTFSSIRGSDSMFYPESQIWRITQQLLKRVNNKVIRYIILKTAIEQAKQSLYISVQEVTRLDSDYGKFGREGQKKAPEEILIQEAYVDELEKLTKSKIDEWYSQKKLINAKNLIYILYRWKEWGGDDNLKKFIDYYTDYETNIGILLSKFLTNVQNLSSDGIEKSTHFELNYKEVKNFLNVDDIYKKLDIVFGPSGTPIENEAINLFKEHYTGKIKNR